MATGDRGTSGAVRWRRLCAAIAAGLVAGLGTVVGVGTPAMAHGQFVSSIPVNGSEVTEPLADLFLYFTEKPTSNAYFAVFSPSGDRVDRLWSHGPTMPLDPPVHEWYHQPNGDWVTRSYSTAYSARVPIAYWPEVGEYRVEYLSVATDGQPVRGQITFTYSGPVSPLPADFRPQRSEPDPNLLAIAVTDAPTAPPSGPSIEDVLGSQPSGPGLWVLWVPVGLALAAALAILAFWRLRPAQARELVVSRFGGRYAAPTPRRPVIPPGLAGKVRAALPVPARAGTSGTGAKADADRAETPAPRGPASAGTTSAAPGTAAGATATEKDADTGARGKAGAATGGTATGGTDGAAAKPGGTPEQGTS
ncbi:MAG: copper resistance protein CopC [Micromonosporaceae bacterium]|nr:copper resistance protein CopC [Micromonosporaceae bacterium]